MRAWIAAVAVLGCACAPVTAPPPFHFAETAQVHHPHQLGVTLTAGGGAMRNMGSGLGGGARARVGVGAHMEVGGEIVLAGIFNGDDPDDRAPWKGNSALLAGKLSWKWGITAGFAVEAGGGASQSATGSAGGFDLGFIASVPGLIRKHWRPYGGVRGELALPVRRALDEAGGTTGGVIIALGAERVLSRKTSLFFELGDMESFNKGYLTTDADPMRKVQSQHHHGNYLALALAFRFGGPAATINGR